MVLFAHAFTERHSPHLSALTDLLSVTGTTGCSILRCPLRHYRVAADSSRLDAASPDEWTDGDSFRTRLPNGRLETFRLYFVDTTESRSRGRRSDEQAAYFGLTREQAIDLGQEAKALQRRRAEPFTIDTRWRGVFGDSRYYAVVFTSKGNDLAELLVSAGLARIYGTRTPLPDGRDSLEYLARLRELENEAKAAHRGVWNRAR